LLSLSDPQTTTMTQFAFIATRSFILIGFVMVGFILGVSVSAEIGVTKESIVYPKIFFWFSICLALIFAIYGHKQLKNLLEI